MNVLSSNQFLLFNAYLTIFPITSAINGASRNHYSVNKCPCGSFPFLLFG